MPEQSWGKAGTAGTQEQDRHSHARHTAAKPSKTIQGPPVEKPPIEITAWKFFHRRTKLGGIQPLVLQLMKLEIKTTGTAF